MIFLSKLVIGCKTCFEGIKNKLGYLVNNKGIIRTPINVLTSYSEHDLNELFTENFSCQYCQTQLEITPNIMVFANTFIKQNKIHIVFEPNFLHIISEREEFKLNWQQDLIYESMKGIMPELTKDETNNILKVAEDIDLHQWFFYINSDHIQQYFIREKYKKNK